MHRRLAVAHKRHLLALTVLATGLFSVSGAVGAWQESTEDATQQSGNEAAADDHAPQVTPAEAGAGDRFFLGGRPQLKRQVGPGLGKPRSILPQPYLPKGSIQVPSAPTSETGLVAGDGAAVEEQAIAQPLEGTVPAEEQLLEDTPMAETDGVAMADETAILAGALQTLDPSGVAVLRGDAGYPTNFWAGYDRASILQAFDRLAQPSAMPGMGAVARKLALSGMMLPPASTDTEIDIFIRARLGVLAAHGDTEGYLALVDNLAADHDWSGLAREIAHAHLLAGRIEDACAVAAQERSDSGAAYWLRIAAFCRAVQGDRVGVDFQLGILEELSNVPATFYQLIDQILVEAEQASGGVLTSGMTLSAPLSVNVLEATMARLARVQVPLLAAGAIDPLAAKSMLTLPGVGVDAKRQLIEAGLAGGWLSADVLSAYIENAPFDEDAALALLEAGDLDDSVSTDVTLALIVAKTTDPLTQTQARDLLRVRMQGNSRAAYLMPVLARLDGADGDAAGQRVRQIKNQVLAGEMRAARQAFTSLRASRAGDDPIVDRQLLTLWPLMALAGGDTAPDVTEDRLMGWVERAGGDQHAVAGLLFTLMEALGETVPEAAWAYAEEGAAQSAGVSVSPAHWRRFLLLAADGDKPGALEQAYRLTASGAVPPAFASSLVAALKELGLEDEARSIATRLVVSYGL